MNALVETSQESTNNIACAAAESEPAQAGLSLVAIGYLFACALILRLWFNFATDHINCYGVSDASEYLRYATAISKLNFMAPVFGPEWKEFAISGPAFPFFLYMCAKLTMSPFNPANSDLFLSAQSLVSALTAALIASCAARLWTARIGLLAGYLAAFYPAFIVNSGRLYSETFFCYLGQLPGLKWNGEPLADFTIAQACGATQTVKNIRAFQIRFAAVCIFQIIPVVQCTDACNWSLGQFLAADVNQILVF